MINKPTTYHPCLNRQHWETATITREFTQKIGGKNSFSIICRSRGRISNFLRYRNGGGDRFRTRRDAREAWRTLQIQSLCKQVDQCIEMTHFSLSRCKAAIVSSRYHSGLQDDNDSPAISAT